MFKRVEKKLARKKEQEELGITEEIKEAIGINDLDSSSDESEASSSSSSPKFSSKRKRPLDDEEVDASSDGQGSDVSDGPEDDDDDDYEVGVQMTIEEALHNPLFIVSIQPDIRGCVVCPHKLLKNDMMASVHMRSQAHQRRISKFREAAGSAKPDDDAQDLLSIVFASTPSRPEPPPDEPTTLSKRATKRIAKFEEMKTKRRKHKAAKARSIAAREVKKLEAGADSESETNDAARTPEPPKKIPKLGLPSSPGKLVKSHPPPTKRKQDEIMSGGQRRPSKESAATDTMTSSKSQLVEKRKRRKGAAN